jgi:hypothetical protein
MDRLLTPQRGQRYPSKYPNGVFTSKIKIASYTCGAIFFAFFSWEKPAMPKKQAGFFKSVKPLPEYKLEIETMTGAYILLDFTERINTLRFNALFDKEYFNTVHTDGDSIIFGRQKSEVKKIHAETLMELILVDGTGDFPYR